MSKLSDKKLKSLKPREKAYRVADGTVPGLVVEVKPNSKKIWKLRYKNLNDKQTMMKLGEYPSVSLSNAREIAREKKGSLELGVDITRNDKNNFKEVFEEWHKLNMPNWKPDYADLIKTRVENNILPWLGGKNINEVKSMDILSALKRVEERGSIESAHRILAYIRQIFEYAQVTRACSQNPAIGLKKGLAKTVKREFPFPREIRRVAEVFKSIHTYHGSFITTSGLKLLSLTMLRPGELRHSVWSSVDFEKKIWGFKKEEMKNDEFDHIVPLSTQAISILRELEPLTRKSDDSYILSSEYTSKRPISENTFNQALRRMGFSNDEIVAHGMRKIASTNLNERGWNKDWVEVQLHHIDGSIRSIYNKAIYLKQRAFMLQAWGDFVEYLVEADNPDLDKLKSTYSLFAEENSSS